MNEYRSNQYEDESRLLERQIYDFEKQLENDNITVRIGDTDDADDAFKNMDLKRSRCFASISQSDNDLPLAQVNITCETIEGLTLGEHLLTRAKREYGMNLFDAATTRPFHRLKRKFGTVVYFSDVVIQETVFDHDIVHIQNITQYILLLCCGRFRYADYLYAICDLRLIDRYVGITYPFNEIVHSPLKWHLNPDRSANNSVLYGITRSDILAPLNVD